MAKFRMQSQNRVLTRTQTFRNCTSSQEVGKLASVSPKSWEPKGLDNKQASKYCCCCRKNQRARSDACTRSPFDSFFTPSYCCKEHFTADALRYRKREEEHLTLSAFVATRTGIAAASLTAIFTHRLNDESKAVRTFMEKSLRSLILTSTAMKIGESLLNCTAADFCCLLVKFFGAKFGGFGGLSLALNSIYHHQKLAKWRF